MLLALATRSDLPAFEVDDRHLHAALQRRGVPFEQPIWNEPAVDWRRYDSVLIRTTWDYQEKLPEFVRWSQAVGAASRLFNPGAVVRWNTHKHYLCELAAAGVPLAPTVWLDRGSTVQVATLMRQHRFERGFLKPCVGSTARETLRFAADAAGTFAAQQHVDRLLPQEDLMLQPYLRSVESRGEWSAICIDGELTHCVRKVPVAGDYRVQDDFGAHDEAYEPTDNERELALATLRLAWREHGPVPDADGRPLLYARADFLWADDGSSVLTELELVEPSLFFRHGPHAAERLLDAWLLRLRER